MSPQQEEVAAAAAAAVSNVEGTGNGALNNENTTENINLDATEARGQQPKKVRSCGCRRPMIPCWTNLIEGGLHVWIRRLVVALSTHAARHPKAWIGIVTLTSFVLVGAGFFTNFQTEFDQMAFLTPQGSLPDVHNNWITNEGGFEALRVLWLALHSDGDNVVHAEAMRRAIILIDQVTGTPGFSEVCSESLYFNEVLRGEVPTNEKEPTCRTFSVTKFWNHNISYFEEQIAALPSSKEQDEYVQQVISNPSYPSGSPVFHEAILGNYVNETIAINGTEEVWAIVSAQSIIMKVDIPDLGVPTDKLEEELLDRLADLQSMWKDTSVKFEYFTFHAYQNEFQRAMNQDLPLVVVLVVVMMSFTCLAFYRRKDKVQSRALLGVFSFATIGMSLLTGYGLMFLIGVPLTSVGIMIPFVVVGVALDDTFIITGAYFRRQREYATNPLRLEGNEATIQIIQETMDEVGISISMTTITTVLCFLFGTFSSIPAVKWLCIYAETTILVDFFYQITYFIAFLTLDEQRVQANRKDCCFWIVMGEDGDEKETTEKGEEREVETKSQVGQANAPNDGFADIPATSDNTMDGDSDSREDLNKIHTPSVEWTLSDGMPPTEEPGEETPPVSSSSKVEKKDIKSKRPSTTTPKRHTLPEHHESHELNRNFIERFMSWYADQLLRPWVKAIVCVAFYVYFVGCTYSTTLLYQEFNVADYIPSDSFLTSFMVVVEEYSTIHRYIGVYFRNVDQSDPEIQRQMDLFVQELSEMPQIGEPPPFFWVRDFEKLAESDQAAGLGLDNLTFNEQVDLALDIPEIRQVFAEDIVRDKNSGNITASRTFLFLREIDMKDIQDQMAMLMDQREITNAQPINEGKSELAFFTFDDLYFFWELYAIVVDELIFTTVSCVIVVGVVAFLCIPHWSAVAFVGPLIIMLYFNLMGTMQYCGIKVNSITYFIIVMAIGLLVDFLMHILLRYYETKGKTRNAKVKETLETMGASILLGGFTTWLGVIPLAFSSTKIFMTVFISFLAMVTLGCSVGLVFLPVLLSLAGPVDVELRSAASRRESPRGTSGNAIEDKWEQKAERSNGERS